MKIVFGGSRSLEQSRELRAVVLSVLAAGHSIQVGCATGADQQVAQVALAAGAADQLSIFAAFDQAGRGAWQCSAVSSCRHASKVGANVHWCAGGPLSLPLRSRLAIRSRAALVGAETLVLFLAQPFSPGSLATAAAAEAAGLQVIAFCQSQPAPLPPAGSWQPSSFFGRHAWQWQPSQSNLF